MIRLFMEPVFNPRLAQVHLRIGDLIVTSEPQCVIVLLGSCISVTMFCRRCKLAGICHALMPRPRSNHTHVETIGGYRYVSQAIPAMLGPFLQRGIRADEIEVKMFGGASVIKAGCDIEQDQGVGNANIIVAREVLKETRLNIIAESVGGKCGRKILFNTETGIVRHKHLSQIHQRILSNTDSRGIS